MCIAQPKFPIVSFWPPEICNLASHTISFYHTLGSDKKYFFYLGFLNCATMQSYAPLSLLNYILHNYSWKSHLTVILNCIILYLEPPVLRISFTRTNTLLLASRTMHCVIHEPSSLSSTHFHVNWWISEKTMIFSD